MELHEFDRIPGDVGVVMKANTITEPWPMRLKLRPGQKGAQEEFNVILGSNLSALEHYVEWKRVKQS